jgi:peptidoglycan-associated lipoprotein
MKNVSQKLCLVVASVALLLAGCSKKPARPAPNQTVLGNTPGGDNINPTGLATELGSGLLPQLGEGVIDDGHTIRGLLKPVYFDFNASSIKESERAKLQAAKEYLEKNPGQRLLLEGHCDWRGTAEYNISLGDRRANAAKKFLGTLGVKADKLESNSKGSLEAKQNASDADAANDRRVELVIIKAP